MWQCLVLGFTFAEAVARMTAPPEAVAMIRRSLMSQDSLAAGSCRRELAAEEIVPGSTRGLAQGIAVRLSEGVACVPKAAPG